MDLNKNVSEADDAILYMCQICQETSKKKHQMSYGCRACFSCKAFFRRAHAHTKTPSFVCKNQDQCEVTVKTKRSCQKCRYALCIGSGMKPELVLTKDQIISRFRKALKKKAEKHCKTLRNIEKH